MDTLFDVGKVILVLVAGWFVTWRVFPWVWVRVGRLLGFRMRFKPVTERRIRRFRRIRRGYWSFVGLTTAFVLSLFLELFVSQRALVIHYDGKTAFPALAEWADGWVPLLKIRSFQRAADFGQVGEAEVDYRLFERWSEDPELLRREIDAETAAIEQERSEWEAKNPPPPETASTGKKKTWEAQKKALERRMASRVEGLASLRRNHEVFASGRAWSWMPLYPYGPSDLRLNLDKNPPNAPDAAQGIPLGTDMSGRDVVPLLLYGFRISLLFALLVTACGYVIGIVVGALQGYFGGWTDLLSQRMVEIWGTIPFLFTVMIIVSMVPATFLLLVGLFVVLRAWESITYYVRGEYLREKAKDYVQAAVGTGVRDRKIMLRHILPNSLVPIVTLAPFAVVVYIGSLVSLDYLGFGLPPGTPSWGALLRQGLENVKFYPHLTYVPTAALALTLFATVMVGEAVREAFDPKVFSRLR
jgi:microcin C transport system permease protein